MLQPFDFYLACKGQIHYMRDVAGEFEAGISAGQRRRISRCKAYSVEPSTPEVCYPIVQGNRERKGRSHSMSMADWQALGGLCFAVVPGPIAAGYVVQVAPKTLYVSAWGDIEGVEKLSPVVLLARGIFNWCRWMRFKVMDIGSAEDEGLIAFKQRLGFTPRAVA